MERITAVLIAPTQPLPGNAIVGMPHVVNLFNNQPTKTSGTKRRVGSLFPIPQN
jgi:hypothetical protein